jgi:hypothetical protein
MTMRIPLVGALAIEGKSSGDRRRFILWPRGQNAAATLPVSIRCELGARFSAPGRRPASCGVTRDLEVGPPRFVGKDGAAYEPG